LQFGVHVGGELAPNSANFLTLPGVVTCQGDSILYGGATGGGFMAGGVVEFSPRGGSGGFVSHLGASLQLLYSSSSSTFETDERIGRSISPQGELSEVVSTYSIATNLTRIQIDPSVVYKVSDDVPLTIGLGPRLGLLAAATYDQKEEIGSPSDATYADGRAERNVRSGDIGETNGLLMGAGLSVGYDLTISPTIALRPELSAALGLNGPVADVDWKQHSLRLGVSLLFRATGRASTPLGPGVER
jgi:hypothetical protein